MAEIKNDRSMSDSRPRFFVLRNNNNPTQKFSFSGNDYKVPLGDTHQDELVKLWGVDDPKLVLQIAQAACGRMSGRNNDGSPITVELIWGRKDEPKKKEKVGLVSAAAPTAKDDKAAPNVVATSTDEAATRTPKERAADKAAAETELNRRRKR